MSLNRLNEAEQRATRNSSRWGVIAWAVLIDSVVLAGLAAAEDAPSPPALVAWVPIGGSSADEGSRMVGWGIRDRGWHDFVAREIVPVLDQGARRVMMHNPFGQLRGEDMQYDQAIHTAEGVAGKHPPLPWLLDGFAAAWRPVAEGRYTGGEPVELIAYLGSPRSDPEFQSLTPASFNRAEASVAPLLEAGFSSIIHDASFAEPAGSWTDVWIAELRRRGMRVGVEPSLHRDGEHFAAGRKLDYVVTTNRPAWRTSPDFYDAVAEHYEALALDGDAAAKLKARQERANARYLNGRFVWLRDIWAADIEGICIINRSPGDKLVIDAIKRKSEGWTVAAPFRRWHEVSKGTTGPRAQKEISE